MIAERLADHALIEIVASSKQDRAAKRAAEYNAKVDAFEAKLYKEFSPHVYKALQVAHLKFTDSSAEFGFRGKLIRILYDPERRDYRGVKSPYVWEVVKGYLPGTSLGEAPIGKLEDELLHCLEEFVS